MAGKQGRKAVGARQEQLRRAKREQRRRERARGLQLVQLTLPAEIAAKLRVAARDERFGDLLERFLDEWTVCVRDYPALAEIAWNIAVDVLPAREAFGIYERNWRFVDVDTLVPRERALIERLADRFGGGIIHA